MTLGTLTLLSFSAKREPAILPGRAASVLARVLTLRFEQRLEAFDDQPLREFLAQREVLAVREHFFQCNHVPYMAVMVTYALEPSSPHSPPRDAAQGRRGTDRGVQVAEAGIPLYDALRDWRADRARRDGVPPYIVCTNQQLAAMIKARPQSMSKLGTIDGVGKAKVEKYGQELLALLARPKGATAPLAEPSATDSRLPGRMSSWPVGRPSAGRPGRRPFAQPAARLSSPLSTSLPATRSKRCATPCIPSTVASTSS